MLRTQGTLVCQPNVQLNAAASSTLFTLEHALYNAPTNSQSRSRRCRRERTGDVRHQRSDLLGRGKSLDERRWTNLRKELLLEFVKRLSLGLRKCVDEVDNSTRFRWARQNTVVR